MLSCGVSVGGCGVAGGWVLVLLQLHESKMVRGMMCEVWLEAEERWVESE